MNETSNALLGPAEIRDLAGRLGVRPTKTLGQNFLHDGGTVRKIVRIAGLKPGERVVEVGPGLGSLTLGLVEAGASVVAIEIDRLLAGQIAETVHARFPDADFEVVLSDALDVTTLPGAPPTALVANLPYNVAVPVLLTMLQRFDSLERVLVMVQAEVADRVAAVPGSKIYGIPSVKAAWYASARRAGTIGRNVFWPAPNVDSALVYLERREPPSTTAPRNGSSRSSMPRSRSAARRCGPRCPGCSARVSPLRRRSVPRVSTRARAGRPWWSSSSRASRNSSRRLRWPSVRRGTSDRAPQRGAAAVGPGSRAREGQPRVARRTGRERRLPPAGDHLPGGDPVRGGHRHAGRAGGRHLADCLRPAGGRGPHRRDEPRLARGRAARRSHGAGGRRRAAHHQGCAGRRGHGRRLCRRRRRAPGLRHALGGRGAALGAGGDGRRARRGRAVLAPWPHRRRYGAGRPADAGDDPRRVPLVLRHTAQRPVDAQRVQAVRRAGRPVDARCRPRPTTPS